jgi:hypothetical protein
MVFASGQDVVAVGVGPGVERADRPKESAAEFGECVVDAGRHSGVRVTRPSRTRARKVCVSIRWLIRHARTVPCRKRLNAEHR